MENIADGQAVLAPDAGDDTQGGRDLRARHYAILHVIEWADAAHSAKGVLAALPYQLAFLGGLGHADLARAAGLAHIPDLIHLLLDILAQSFQLNEQDGGRIHGI